MNVKIRKLRADAVLPQYETDGASGFDLVAGEDVIIAPGEPSYCDECGETVLEGTNVSADELQAILDAIGVNYEITEKLEGSETYGD